MRIHVNGQAREVSATTLAALLEELDLDPRTVAVERNGELVRRDALAATRLREGDRVEIVHMVCGG